MGSEIKKVDSSGYVQQPQPKILGAKPLGGEFQILDQSSQNPPQNVEVRVHEEVITLDEKLRSQPKQEGEPEIRMRVAPTQKEFDKVKRLEDE